MNQFLACSLWLLALVMNPLLAQSSDAPSEPKDVVYARTLNDRAAKITAALRLADPEKSNRVHRLVVEQYRALNAIHFVRDNEIQNAKANAGAEKAATAAATQAAREAAKPKLDKLHGEFLGRLSAELSSGQIDQVKDGMTYGVLPLTYSVYLKMYPDLTDEQKAQIKAWLTEAREIAMDGSTSEEKHAVFGKYKGRINNYLSKAGYDAKKAEQNLKKSSEAGSEKSAKP